ncbi:MAG: hypothetical protein RBS37_00510 [Bacteroidales bacterium]|jgi:hypothetical protein|nr:hypothetical protein [Bacteroidales bacterium]
MKANELLNLIEKGLQTGIGAEDLHSRMKSEGVDYNFGQGFTGRVMDRISDGLTLAARQVDFVSSLNSIFYRVAFAGVAAIIIMLISIFISEGSLTLNAIVGISDTIDENLISLITEN